MSPEAEYVRITVTIPIELREWYKKHSEVNVSGLVKRCLEEYRSRNP